MKNRKWIIFIIALLLRILFFLLESPWNNEILENKIIPMGTDQRGYNQLALNLIETNELTFKAGLPPTALRTPGYPVFLAIIYLIFGKLPWVVILFQVLLDSFTAIIIYFSFKKLLNEKIGLIGGFIYSLDPHLILHSNTLYSDTLFVFFLSVFMFFLISLLSDRNYLTRDIILSGLFLGLASLVKPASAYLPYVIVLFLFFFFKVKLIKRIKYALLFLLLYFVTISPWLIRNELIFGKPFLSNSGEYNLLAINITPMEIPKRKLPQHIVEYQLRAEADSLMISEGKQTIFTGKPNDYWEELTLQLDYNKTEYWKRVAIKYIKEDPIIFIKYYTIGIFHSLFNLGSKEFAYYLNITNKPSGINIKSEQNIFRLFIRFFSEKTLPEILIGISISLYLFIIYLGGLLGLIQINYQQNKHILVLLIVIAIYFLLIAGAGGLARFKLPAIPFYIAIVSIGLNYLFDLLKKNFLKRIFLFN